MTHQNPTPNIIYINDARDCLNRSREILEYVIDMHTATRDLSEPGLGWILAEVQTGIVDSMALLNSAVAASAEPSSH